MSKARTIEILLNGAAAAWVAVCVGAALILGAPGFGISKPLPVAAASCAAAALIAYRALASLSGPPHRLPEFDLLPIETSAPEAVAGSYAELVLTPAMAVRRTPSELLLTPDMAVLTSELLLTRGQMLGRAVEEPSVPLLLDDVLAELRPDSRVVQLFDPERMPTAGQLKSRIDRHLGRVARDAPARHAPDASQALYDALADLRRSLS
jgi:hypothetical protein